MSKNRFGASPFKKLILSDVEKESWKDFGNNIIHQNIVKSTVDENKWKLIKTKENIRVYLDRTKTTELPEFFVTGTTWGTGDDFMYGAVNPTIEAMRAKAIYIEDMSGGAVLASLEEPTIEEPLNSMSVKWMELDLPFASTTLVKNRDYVYLECTKLTHLANGERVGVMIFRSINFAQTKTLSGRVRANITVCCIARQVDSDTIELYGSGFVDQASGVMKPFVASSIASGYLTMLKYTNCSIMKKMVWVLEKRYARRMELGAPNRHTICATCTKSLTKLHTGDYTKSARSICKLCSGHLCDSCKIRRKLVLVGPDLQLEPRKVTVCGPCLQNVRVMSPLEAAREAAISRGKTTAITASSIASSDSN